VNDNERLRNGALAAPANAKSAGANTNSLARSSTARNPADSAGAVALGGRGDMDF